MCTNSQLISGCATGCKSDSSSAIYFCLHSWHLAVAERPLEMARPQSHRTRPSSMLVSLMSIRPGFTHLQSSGWHLHSNCPSRPPKKECCRWLAVYPTPDSLRCRLRSYNISVTYSTSFDLLQVAPTVPTNRGEPWFVFMDFPDHITMTAILRLVWWGCHATSHTTIPIKTNGKNNNQVRDTQI